MDDRPSFHRFYATFPEWDGTTLAADSVAIDPVVTVRTGVHSLNTPRAIARQLFLEWQIENGLVTLTYSVSDGTRTVQPLYPDNYHFDSFSQLVSAVDEGQGAALRTAKSKSATLATITEAMRRAWQNHLERSHENGDAFLRSHQGTLLMEFINA